MNVWSRSAAWGALFFLCACGVAYDVGPHVDGGSTTQVNSGGQGGGLAPDSVAAPPPAVAIQGIPFACERWGKGNPLGGIAGLIAMENVAFLLWTAPEQQDQQKLALATEAIQTYLPLVETSGDLYCVALHMLENNRAVVGVSSFYRTWLGLDAYPEKDPVLFPGYDHDRLALMARDALDFLVDVTLRGDRNFQRLWTSERPLTLAPAWQSTAEQIPTSLAPYAAGLLAEPGVIALTGRARLVPSARGAWFFDKVMCLRPAPLEGVKELFQSSVPMPGESYRSHFQRELNRQEFCRPCHAHFDPVGFALDPFDVVGRLQPKDVYGQPFDTSGVLRYSYTGDFSPPPGNPDGVLPFASLAELGQLLSTHLESQACYAQRWLTYSHAPEDMPTDHVWDKAKHLAETLRAHDGQIRFLIAAVLEERFGS